MYIIYGKPNCPYCDRAKELLDSKGLEYQYHNVMADGFWFAEMVKTVIAATGSRPGTVPQIVSPEGEYIGGFDSLHATFSLKATLEDFEDVEL